MKKTAKKSTRVLISLPEKFLSDIDLLADEEQRSRSELIREALRNYIRTHDPEGLKANFAD
jgi:metal-responsive CopG/Arc/MetJ family transcriptional regulator